MRTTHHSVQRLALTERRAQVAANRLGGMTIREIAEALGVPKSTVHDDLQALEREWRAAALRDLETHKAIESRRLDVLLNACWSRAVSGHLLAIDRALKIEEARRKLLGLDAPLRVQDVTAEPEQRRTVTLDELMARLPTDAVDAIDLAARALEKEWEEAERLARATGGVAAPVVA